MWFAKTTGLLQDVVKFGEVDEENHGLGAGGLCLLRRLLYLLEGTLTVPSSWALPRAGENCQREITRVISIMGRRAAVRVQRPKIVGDGGTHGLFGMIRLHNHRRRRLPWHLVVFDRTRHFEYYVLHGVKIIRPRIAKFFDGWEPPGIVFRRVDSDRRGPVILSASKPKVSM